MDAMENEQEPIDKDVVMARLIALDAHAGQSDKAGRPYVDHVIRVAALVSGRDAKIAALLHDVIEDCDRYPLTDVAAWFGTQVATAVDALTHRRGERRDDYLRRVAESSLAVKVKLADLFDNSDHNRLAMLEQATTRRLVDKYDYALSVLVGIAVLPMETVPRRYDREIGLVYRKGKIVRVVYRGADDDGSIFLDLARGERQRGAVGWTPMPSA